MDSVKISVTISEVCQRLGIDFHSCNEKYISYVKDAKELSEIYLDLKLLIGRIKFIEERYNLNGLRTPFEQAISGLENIDHDIIKLARKLTEEK